MTHALSTILASAASIILLLAVLELVRRRRLREKYALLWILTAIVLLVLSLWRGLVDSIAIALGISYGPLITIGVGALFVLIVLLHYSTVISALTDRTVELAQHVAMLEHRVRELESQNGDRTEGPGSGHAD